MGYKDRITKILNLNSIKKQGHKKTGFFEKASYFKQALSIAFLIIFSTLSFANSTDPNPKYISGKIVSVSSIPSPEKSSYSDCDFTIQVVLNNSSKENIILVVPCFRNKTLVPESKLKQGDMIKFTILQKNQIAQDRLQTQISDTIQAFEYEQYYVSHVEKQSNGERENLKKEISLSVSKSQEQKLPEIQPRDKEIEKKRQEAILYEKILIADYIRNYGGTWEGCLQKRALQNKKYITFYTNNAKNEKYCYKWIDGKHLFRFTKIRPFLGEKYNDLNDYNNTVVDNLVALDRLCRRFGADLIVCPVPPAEYFTFDIFADEYIADSYPIDLLFELNKLLEHNIEVINVFPALFKLRDIEPVLYLYDHPNERHQRSGVNKAVAQLIANRLYRYSDLSDINGKLEIATVHNSKYPAGSLYYKEGTPISSQTVLLNQKSWFQQAQKHIDSSILFIGDSLCHYPSLDSAIPAFCSYYTKKKISQFTRANLIGKINNFYRYDILSHLKNRKKVVIFVFSANLLRHTWSPKQQLDKHTIIQAKKYTEKKEIIFDRSMKEIDKYFTVSYYKSKYSTAPKKLIQDDGLLLDFQWQHAIKMTMKTSIKKPLIAEIEFTTSPGKMQFIEQHDSDNKIQKDFILTNQLKWHDYYVLQGFYGMIFFNNFRNMPVIIKKITFYY